MRPGVGVGRSLSGRVYTRLKDRLPQGEYLPSSRLVEDEIAKEFGVPRRRSVRRCTGSWLKSSSCEKSTELYTVHFPLPTAHIALGDNRLLGRQVDSPMHMDMIFAQPTVLFDETPVLRDGTLLIQP